MSFSVTYPNFVREGGGEETSRMSVFLSIPIISSSLRFIYRLIGRLLSNQRLKILKLCLEGYGKVHSKGIYVHHSLIFSLIRPNQTTPNQTNSHVTNPLIIRRYIFLKRLYSVRELSPGSLPCSQKAATEPYRGPELSSLPLHIDLSVIHLNTDMMPARQNCGARVGTHY
jgi:hypothetical protein